tara:strand:- start:6682 stop:7290 length:609 start_codon:yes stop_codon:yes gene_type:complete
MKLIMENWRKYFVESNKETSEQAIERKLKRLLSTDQNQFMELLPATDKPLEHFLQPLGFEGILRLVTNKQAASPEILSAVFEAAQEPQEDEERSWLRVDPWERRHLRNRVGQNPSTPPSILWNLLDDPGTRVGMTMNKAAPPEILDKMARMTKDYHRNIVNNPNTSLETLKFISKEHEGDDESWTDFWANKEIERRKRSLAI